MAKVIIVGATSGIGKALAEKYIAEGHTVGITGRRETLLKQTAEEFPGKVFYEVMDIRETASVLQGMQALFAQLKRVDIIVVNAGIGHVNWSLDWEIERQTILTNVYGCSRVLNAAMQYFKQMGKGKLACVTSVAGIRGFGGAPAYGASKAFLMHYLESLRAVAFQWQVDISIVDIRPGFVDTKMGTRSAFWRISPETAAKQIYAAIAAGQKEAYISSRWRIAAWLLKAIPGRWLRRLR